MEINFVIPSMKLNMPILVFSYMKLEIDMLWVFRKLCALT